MQIGPEIFERIPLVVEGERRSNSLEPRKFRIVDDDICRLQTRRTTVSDKFAAEHSQIRIRILSMCDVAVRVIFGIGLRMESITGSVNADETKTVVNGVEKRLLALR